MPLAKLKPTLFAAPDQRLTRTLTTETEGMVGMPSPARLLQQRLEYQAATLAMPSVERWPIGRSMALIVASSVALWVAILEAGATLVHTIA